MINFKNIPESDKPRERLYQYGSENLSDEELISKLDTTDVFARMNPIQKERVVSLYKKCGHIVGYMGDGVNDAPSLSSADVGISVNTASSIAKESSDIIILQQSLKVVYQLHSRY